MKYLSFLLLVVPLLCLGVNVKPTQAQDSFASHCYLSNALLQRSGKGAAKYATIYPGYEICAYYKPNEPIKVKGNDGTTEFKVPEDKTIQQCIDEMIKNKTKTCK